MGDFSFISNLTGLDVKHAAASPSVLVVIYKVSKASREALKGAMAV